MRPLAELISDDPAWPLVKQWIAASPHRVEVLPRSAPDAEATLSSLQVTTRSPMGAVAFETGGVIAFDGWIRILGGGCPEMTGSLVHWNSEEIDPPVTGALIVAYDAIGGFFALDGGALGPGRGGVYYFAPDTLSWEDLGRSYSQLLDLFFSSEIGGFYDDYCFEPWTQMARTMAPDEALFLFPPLWTKEGKAYADVKASPIAATSLWKSQHGFAQDLLAGPNPK